MPTLFIIGFDGDLGDPLLTNDRTVKFIHCELQYGARTANLRIPVDITGRESEPVERYLSDLRELTNALEAVIREKKILVQERPA